VEEKIATNGRTGAGTETITSQVRGKGETG
jgi:hypothetical protein